MKYDLQLNSPDVGSSSWLATSETVTLLADSTHIEDAGVDGVIVANDAESGIGDVEGGRGAEDVEGDVRGSLKRDLDDSVERDGEEGMHHEEQVKPVGDDVERGVGDDARVVQDERFTQENGGDGRE